MILFNVLDYFFAWPTDRENELIGQYFLCQMDYGLSIQYKIDKTYQKIHFNQYRTNNWPGPIKISINGQTNFNLGRDHHVFLGKLINQQQGKFIASYISFEQASSDEIKYAIESDLYKEQIIKAL